LFFSPSSKKEERNPTHKTAHLQITQTTARPEFAKELFFCHRTTANLESLVSLDKFVKSNTSK